MNIERSLRRRSLGAALTLGGALALLLGSGGAQAAPQVPWKAGTGACGRTVTVSSGATLAAAAGSAQPGDCIVVANGSYAGLGISRSGTAANPITIAAATQLQAVFTST